MTNIPTWYEGKFPRYVINEVILETIIKQAPKITAAVNCWKNEYILNKKTM